MTWKPGDPIVSPGDEAAYRAWCKERKLSAQRARRAAHRRIDYYPSEAARDVIDARTFGSVGGDYSSVIDALVLAGARKVPERDW